MTELIRALPGKTGRVNPNRFADGLFAPPAGDYVTEVEIVLFLHQPPLLPGPSCEFEIYPRQEKLTVLVYHDAPKISFCEAKAKGKEALLQVFQDLESALASVRQSRDPPGRFDAVGAFPAYHARMIPKVKCRPRWGAVEGFSRQELSSSVFLPVNSLSSASSASMSRRNIVRAHSEQ